VKIICIFSSSVKDESEEEGFLSRPLLRRETEGILVRAGFFGGTANDLGSKGGGGVDWQEETTGGDGVSDLGSNLLPTRPSPSGELRGEALDEFGLVLFSLLYPLSWLVLDFFLTSLLLLISFPSIKP